MEKSKTGLPKSTPLQYVIFSRITDKELRQQLEVPGEGWTEHLSYTEEHKALADYIWLSRKTPGAYRLREYVLTASFRGPLTRKMCPEEFMFDDELPF